jgi:Spy/CpxP family protein refolding chaperone
MTTWLKPWIKRSLIGIFGGALLFGGLAACSHHRGHDGPMSEADITQIRERFIDKASRELTLDEAQKARLGVLADAIKAQRSALMAGGVDPRSEMAALLAGPQFDRARAQALIDAKTGAVRDKAPSVVAAMADFFDSLRPEQQQKVRDFLARGHGHGFGRG